MLTDGTTLADQLIQPLFNEHAIALAVDVSPLRRAQHEPVEEYVESCGVGEAAGRMMRCGLRA